MSYTRNIIFISIFCLCFFYFSPAQKIIERGELSIRNYHQNEYKGSAQNFGIVQDKRGILYFANNGGVLEYDGVSWRLMRMPNNSVVKSLCIDDSGRIYVGAQSEFGYLAPDSSGLLSYFSLTEHIPDSNKNFDNVGKTFSTNRGIYFQTDHYLFLWNGTTMKMWDPEVDFYTFLVNNKLYIYEIKRGLFVMNGEEIAPVIDGEEFADKTVADIISLDHDKMLVITKKHGTFLMTSDGLVYEKTTAKTSEKKIPSAFLNKETNDFFRERIIHSVIKISEDLFAFGTWGDGVIIVHKDGYLVRAIGKEAGLQDNVIQSLFIDDNKNLWIALDNGIAKVEINSPITSFTEKSGLATNIETVVRHNEKLYVGTHSGIYYLDSKSNSSNNKSSLFLPLPGSSMECWDLFSFKKGNISVLLAGLNDGIFEIKPDHSSSIIVQCAPWTIMQSEKDPNRIYIGLDDGIMSIYYDNGKWLNEGRIKNIDELIFKIAEDEQGNLWLATQKKGVLKLNFYVSDDMSSVVAKQGIQRDVKIFRYSEKHGLPDGDFVVIKEKNKSPVFGTDRGIYTFDEKSDLFYKDTVLLKNMNRENWGIHRFNIDSKGNLWLVIYKGSEFEIGFVKFLNDNSFIWNSIPFVEISKGVIHAIFHDSNGITWLGGVDGLYRYDSNIEKDYTIPYNTLVRKVTIGEDSSVFKGTNFNENGLASIEQSSIFKYKLNYGTNSIIFEYAAQSYENEPTLYSRYLEGFDKGWSEWKTETKAVYTNLHEGNYIFRVKARNMYRNTSSEATYEFGILPPWYRTIWAYILYFLLFTGILYAGIKMNIRRLEAKNRELEVIVAERTKEVVHQKEVIEHKNRDIMDSINYAQGIQQAILPPDEKFKKYLSDSFILFMPRDVVSGDFYWMEVVVGNSSNSEEKTAGTTATATVLFAVCDCTGHGVPGGFVSMVGQNGLRRAVNEQGLVQPAQILDSVALIVEEAFSKGKRKDGMDAILCSLRNNSILEYSAANNPLYIVRKKETGLLHESISATRISSLENQTKSVELEKPIVADVENETHYLFHLDPDKQPVGAYDYRKPFSNHHFILKPGDTVYLSSDGFRDQFGGPKGKKYMAKNFKQLLISIQDKSMSEQKNLLQKSIVDWMGNEGQNDDICVIGVRV